MYLKELNLKGFKSFADKIRLKFEPGIIVIVGPNGSGKSNLTDAILWALGEQSPSSLRSSLMEDVIFSGSEKRGPLDLAEAVVVLDNVDGYLPIEFSEVTITRRSFRSGESDYFINNSLCRLLDIQELLSDSGVGRDMYSIISQGRLEEVLNSKPEEKRALIEEAAGVLKHKKRKERALRRINSMEQNLTRAKDVAREVDRQLAPLRTQAAKAENYTKLASEVKDLKVKVAVSELKDLRVLWNGLLRKEEELKAKNPPLSERAKILEDEVQKLQAELEEGSLGQANRGINRLREIREKANSSALLLEERKRNLASSTQVTLNEVNKLEEKKSYWGKEAVRLEGEKGKSDDEVSNLYEELKEARSLAERVKKERLELDKSLREKEAKIQTLQSSVASNKEALSLLKAKIENEANKIGFLENQSSTLKSKNKGEQKELAAICSNKQLLEEELFSKEGALEEKNLKVKRLKEEIALAEERKHQLLLKVADASAKRKVLEELVKKEKAFPAGSQWLLGNKRGKAKILGALKDVIEVPAKYEKGIEAALGLDLFCLLVKDIKEAENLVSMLQEGKQSEASLLYLRKQPSSPSEAIKSATPALKVIKVVKDSLRKAVEGLLRNTYVAASFKEALLLGEKYPDFVFVTPRGEAVFPGGKITVGARTKGYSSVFGSKRELLEVSSLEKKLSSSLRVEDKDLKALKLKLEKEESKREHLASQCQQKKERLLSLEAQSKRLGDDHSEAEKLQQRHLEELENLKAELLQEEAKGREKGIELAALVKEAEPLEKEIAQLASSRERLLEKEKEVVVRLASVQSKVSSYSEKELHVKRQIILAQREADELEEEIARQKVVISSNNELSKKMANLAKVFKQLFRAIEFRMKEFNKLTRLQEGKFKKTQKLIQSKEQEIKSLQERKASVEAELHQLEIRKAQLELKVTAATQKLTDEYEVPLETALVSLPDDFSSQQSSAKLEELERKIGRLGPINPIAVGEYNSLNERYQFLTNQISDLLESKKSLSRIIRAIEKKMKDKFLQAFNEVNTHFQSVFSYLFPGGKANLYLTCPDDLLNTGIDVVAEPSGKKLKRLTLLSGGERALVSLALLFAVYYTRPSPFYILDEVEPALDDINLQRFISLLERLKGKVQFLIITHQRRTMEIADVLYGVTMQADGVSKVISQKLEQKETETPAYV